VLWAIVHDHSRESEVDSCRKKNWGNRKTDDLAIIYQHRSSEQFEVGNVRGSRYSFKKFQD
jgi:hypothetical protein